MKFYTFSVFFIRGGDRDFYFLSSLVVLFNSYHYAENLIAIIYSTLPFKENKQNIPPCEKEICHIFYYFRAFIADRDVDSESHQYENLQTPPSQLR